MKDDNRNKKSQPQAVNQSQPNQNEQQSRRQVVEQEQTTNNSHLRDILVNARNHEFVLFRYLVSLSILVFCFKILE